MFTFRCKHVYYVPNGKYRCTIHEEHNNHVYDGNLKQSLYSQWIVHLKYNCISVLDQDEKK